MDDTAPLADVVGWSDYPGTAWTEGTSTIDSTNGNAGWTCYKFTGTRTTLDITPTEVTDAFTQMSNGIFTNIYIFKTSRLR
eukprot:UN17439